VRRPGRQVRHELSPSVNLLSPWVFEVIAARQLRLRFMAAAAVLALLVGLGWAVQRVRIDRVEQSLAVEQAQTGRLSTHTSELAAVRTFVSSVNSQKLLARRAMRKEVFASRLMEGLKRAIPTGARVDTITITLAADTDAEAAAPSTQADVPSATCPGPDPYSTRAVAGCITLTGSADSRASVGDFVVNLGDDQLFVEPFISTTTTAEGDELTFTGSVGISRKAYSRRYARINALLDRGTG
jgi:Tfp pilus assembly protein PilN